MNGKLRFSDLGPGHIHLSATLLLICCLLSNQFLKVKKKKNLNFELKYNIHAFHELRINPL